MSMSTMKTINTFPYSQSAIQVSKYTLTKNKGALGRWIMICSE